MRHHWMLAGATILLCILGSPFQLHAQVVDTVRVGSSALLGSRPELGTSRVEGFVRVDGSETLTSVTTQRVTTGVWGEGEIVVIETVHVGEEGDTTNSAAVVRAADLSLLHHRVKAERDSAAVSTTAGSLTGWVVLPDEAVRLLDLPLSRGVFPVAGQVPWLFPLLPLSEGYAAAISHFSQWEGVEEWSTIRVLGSERIESSGVARDCWRIDGGELFPGFRITYWVDKENRRILLGVASGEGSGPEYLARLVRFDPAI